MSSSAQPNLSLCMIVRDSARTLGACLESIRPWVDEIIVVDTGSVDETRDIAKAFGAQLFEFPWVDDFSAARNESFRLARGRWLFWMDSDDTIDASIGQRLRTLACGPHAGDVLGYVVQVHCPAGLGGELDGVTVVDHVKLVRNHLELRFEGRIHEQLLPAIHRLGGRVEWTDLFVVHSGADYSEQGKKRKYERDLHLLTLDLRDRPNHPFVLFNLGMTYSDMGDHQAAEHWLRQCVQVSNDGESTVRKAYALLVHSLKEQRRFTEAVQVCAHGLSLFPKDVELLFRSGTLAHETGQLHEAIATYRAALESREDRHFVSIDQGLFGYKTRNNLALVFEEAGQHELAEIQWRTIIETNPEFRPAWRGLGRSLALRKKWTSFETLLENLLEQPDCHADVYWLQSHAAQARGDAAAVRPFFEAALACDANHVAALQDYCRWLFEFGTLEEAERSLIELTERAPTDGAAFHNLGIVYIRSGKLRHAIDALEHSLQLRPDSLPTRQELERLRDKASLPHLNSQARIAAEVAPAATGAQATRQSMSEHHREPIPRPLDIVYLFRHSPHGDREIMYSLRSVASCLPYVRKVWIFGDRPAFLTHDISIAEHVPHELLASPLGFRTPVCNELVMTFLASLIPDLAFDFVKFSDDFVVLEPISRACLCQLRATEDMNQIPVRGRGVFKDFLWWTHDTLKRCGYPGYSFEAHVPQPYTRQLVLDAFREFRDFISEDRYFGLVSGTSLCNFAVHKRGMPFVWLSEESSKAGFYKSCPTTNEIEAECAGKFFLNFTDKTFRDSMVRFLDHRFPQPCKFELASID